MNVLNWFASLSDEIKAAIIGGVAAIIAALIGVWFTRSTSSGAPAVQPHIPPVVEPPLLPPKLPPPSRLESVTAARRLRCGAIKHPPLSDYRSAAGGDDMFGGYYVELAMHVAKRNGYDIDFERIGWHEFTSDVFKTRDVDLVLSVFETSERRAQAGFTCFFHRVGLCAAVHRDSPLQTEVDLGARTLRWAASKGEAGWEHIIKERRIRSDDAIVVEHPDIAQALRQLGNGAADVAVVDRLTGEQYLRAHPDEQIRLIAGDIYLFKNAIMIPRDDGPFEEWVRREFTRSRESAEMSAREAHMLIECRGAVTKYA